MKKLILIKLGGSLITEKDVPYTVRNSIIQNIVSELKEILSVNSEYAFLLGNGAGSFGHYPVEHYNLKEGMYLSEQIFGFSIVQDGVARLNRIIVDALLKQTIAACSLSPSSLLTSINGKKGKLFTDSLLGFLRSGITPVVYGDIVYDEKVGCHVFSIEDLFSLFLPQLIMHNYKVEKIIHLTSVPGVFDKENQVIPFITQKNIQEVRRYIFQARGFDVTGGMGHKIDAALLYAKKGISTYIIQGGTDEKLLTKVIFDKKFIGTTISE